MMTLMLLLQASYAFKQNQAYRTLRFWNYVAPVASKYLTVLLSPDDDEKAWQEAHRLGGKMFRACVDELGGFYVKTGQIVASRQDLFPTEYSEALSGLTDMVDPLPESVVKQVIREECNKDVELGTILGAASVAQVHRAYYGGREIAIKVQRPNCEDVLLGDVKQLKLLAGLVREYTPVDYFLVFSELERQLADEFDFVNEAAAMSRIKAALADDPPLLVPSVVPELCTRRVLAMDLIPGEPLSRFAEVDSIPQAASREVLRSLTTAFGRCILETGFFHADPHPGNLMLDEQGRIALIDYGQVKQISGAARVTLGNVCIALAERTKTEEHPSGSPEDLQRIADLALELGVKLDESLLPEGPAAVAIWLFDDANEALPGGFEQNELSPNSPAYALESFPEDLVLVARATVLIKGLAYKLGCQWSLASEWAAIAKRQQLSSSSSYAAAAAAGDDHRAGPVLEDRVRFRTVAKLALAYTRGKVKSIVRPFVARRTMLKIKPPPSSSKSH